MTWLTQNWLLVVIFVAFMAMHAFGHGGHGGHASHDAKRSQDDSTNDETQARRQNSRGGGHQH